MKRTHADANCPTCDTLYTHLPVEFDGQDAYAVLELKPCAHETCGKLLCEACERFACDGCGETFCRTHLVSVPDSPKPLQCCAACASECEPLPLPMGPGRETRIAAVASQEVA